MTFTTSIFLIGMFPWFLCLYRFLGTRENAGIRSRIVLLLFANSIFYIWGGIGTFCFLLIYSAVIYLLECVTARFHKKWLLALSVVFAVLPLAFVKYTVFLISNINAIFGSEIASPSLIVPAGISFFTFEAISLLVDLYRGEVLKTNLLHTYLYLSFFATVTSGPIIRYNEFEYGLLEPEVKNRDAYAAIEQVVLGLSKKLLIADKLAPLSDYYFTGTANGNEYSALGLWFGSIAYTLQLYFDFSGYSDMAVGIGSLLGFDIRPNFNKPYQSSTISEFWKRWHMSLTQWFRDYIYIPLGGNRCSVSRHIGNMLLVWLVTGIWHGADWTFILWGLGYFVLLLLEKYTGLAKRMQGTIWGHLYTLFFVNLLWVFFRADNLSVASQYVFGMFGGGAFALEDKALRFLPFLLFAVLLCNPWERWLSSLQSRKWYQTVRSLLFIGLAALSICALINATYAPYIYGNF